MVAISVIYPPNPAQTPSSTMPPEPAGPAPVIRENKAAPERPNEAAVASNSPASPPPRRTRQVMLHRRSKIAGASRAEGATPPAIGPVPSTSAPPEMRGIASPASPIANDAAASGRPIAGPPQPTYPEMLLEQGREGSVDMECTILTDGRAQGCRITASHGSSRFTEAALAWVATVRYAPASHNGKPIPEHHHRIHIDFKIQ